MARSRPTTRFHLHVGFILALLAGPLCGEGLPQDDVPPELQDLADRLGELWTQGHGGDRAAFAEYGDIVSMLSPEQRAGIFGPTEAEQAAAAAAADDDDDDPGSEEDLNDLNDETPEGINNAIDRYIADGRSDSAQAIWDNLTPENRMKVNNLRRQRQGQHVTGEAWAGYTSAFLSSTLFEVDEHFQQALGENLCALGHETGQSVPELVRQKNWQIISAAAAEANSIKLEAFGDQVLAAYDQAVIDTVIHPGQFPYAHSTAMNRSALMVQDGFLGAVLRLRYQLNTLKTGTGEVPEGNFVMQPGYQVYTTFTGRLRKIGWFEQNYGGGMTSTTDRLKDELTDFLSLPGVEGTPEHLVRRTQFIGFLTSLDRPRGCENAVNANSR